MNATLYNKKILIDEITEQWELNSSSFMSGFDNIDKIKKESMNKFFEMGFPTKNLENWKGSDLSNRIDKHYSIFHNPPSQEFNPHDIFKCDVPSLNLPQLFKKNGFLVDNKITKSNLPQGVVICNLKEAFEKYPEIIEKYFNKISSKDNDSIRHLNTGLFQDGLFIYVPENTVVEPGIQLIDIVVGEDNLMVNTRNLIILEKNSKLTLIQCEESINLLPGFINSVSEIVLEDNSNLDFYRIFNKDDETTILSSVYATQQRDSNLQILSLCLNGGFIRNQIEVNLEKENSFADVLGLYILGLEQHVDNQVLINHKAPNCQSNQLFKGILDDIATGVFNGYINVFPNASQTLGMQTNKNILLSDKAKIETRPFLEIYNDDVKCSHGATIGQLDSEAMFYLKARGIGEATANVLLLYAFVAEVINNIKIPVLQLQIDDMTKKRLRGDLNQCSVCALNCSQPENMDKFLNFVSEMN